MFVVVFGACIWTWQQRPVGVERVRSVMAKVTACEKEMTQGWVTKRRGHTPQTAAQKNQTEYATEKTEKIPRTTELGRASLVSIQKSRAEVNKSILRPAVEQRARHLNPPIAPFEISPGPTHRAAVWSCNP